MKRFKKWLGIVLCAAMVLTMGIVPSFVADLTEGTKDAAKTITITTPSGAQDSDEFTYKIYKVFDATSNGTDEAIAYKIDSKNGDLTDAMKEAGFS